MNATTRIAAALGLLASLRLDAGTPFFATGKVLPSIEADGTASDAFKFAGVTLVRHNVPQETAIQMGGPDPLFQERIFPKDAATSYFLTDAGSQWPSPVTQGQPVLAVLEAFPGQFGWAGEAYAGAASKQVEKTDLARSLMSLPDVWMAKIPSPSLISASTSEIRFKIEQFKDLSGLATGLAIWRRELNVQNWSYLESIPMPPAQGAEYQDQTVQGNQSYEYSASVNFAWPGGSGAGSLPTESGLYSTIGKSKGILMAASTTQPTPIQTAGPKASPQPLIDLKDGWLPFPNPVLNDDLHLAVDMPWPGLAVAKFFALDGSKVREWKREFPAKGQSRAVVSFKGLSGGIYIMKLFIESPQGSQIELKAKKIAILR